MSEVTDTKLSFWAFLNKKETLDVAVSLWRNVAASIGILGIGVGLMCKTDELFAMIAAGVVQLVALSAIGASVRLAYVTLREASAGKFSLSRNAICATWLLATVTLILTVWSGYVLLVHFIGSNYWDKAWLGVILLIAVVIQVLMGFDDRRHKKSKGKQDPTPPPASL
ncbi:hypothetical protein SN15_14585 [Stenotrophomonas maltophilia]|nr:hypothetical protein SN15_14585 [Stenotrophomonas maltophilia]